MADEQQLRSYLKRVTIELAEERKRSHAIRHEPIAIVGMACRYPGRVSSPEGLWRMLADGANGISEFPADRDWDLEHFADSAPGDSLAPKAGFVQGALEFDPGFFGISSREALAMDPQQRLLLEVAWEALENATVTPPSLHGSETGVFVGMMHHEYAFHLLHAPDDLGPYRTPGAASSVASGRISYVLGLQGPAVTIDTACSSSLVALHLAAQALRQGECSLALSGGVSVLTSTQVFTELGRLGNLAPDGHCKSFAEAADGAGFSEGVGVLVLERLSDAERNGHPILATIRGSAVNQDGASNGLTAPNGPSQERVIRQALANARLTPQDIDAVEAHGTGTTLGDPIEAGALLATYGQDRDKPLALGSIKSNIGHAQAAAGVAGVIKTVMAMREGVLPRTLHVDKPSSNVDWEAGKVELLTEAQEWKSNGRPRRAGVSSFGISGTNAHVILEEAPAPAGAGAGGEEEPEPGVSSEQPEAVQPLPGPIPLVLSAKTEPALRESASRIASHLEDNPDLDPADVAYSLATTRSAFEHRAVALGSDREALLDSLEAIAQGADSPSTARGRCSATRHPVFLFPGHGTQWKGMALGLFEDSPAFARHMNECELALAPHVDWSLREILREEDGNWLDRLDVVQPALFAVMVSLAGLWRELGVEPAVVVGHSQGEIAAAHVAGGLSLEDAARLAAVRSQIISKLIGQGALVSIALSAEQLDQRLQRWEGRIEVAALNGPSSTVLSGDGGALDELLEQCAAEGIRARKMPTSMASHSTYVEALREETLEAVAGISPRAGDIPFHSTVTGGLLDTAELGPEYWYRNLRQTVLLEPVTRALLRQGHRTLVEISPHPVLALALGETIEEELAEPREATVLGTLRREEGGPERFALSLAQAHAAGASPDWDTFFQGTNAKLVPLPTYPFQRKRYWLSAQANGGDPSAIGQSAADHPLLAAKVEDPDGESLTLTGRISLATHPWLADHAVADTVLLPGTAFVELALKAAQEAGAEGIEELTLQAPLVIPESGAIQIQVSVASPEEDGNREISIHSRPQAAGEEEPLEWILHVQGLLSEEPPQAAQPLQAWPPQGAEPIEVDDLYERLADVGLGYGPAFQGLTAAWRRGDEVFAEVSLLEEQRGEAQRFVLHPVLLDSILQAGSPSLVSSAPDSGVSDMAFPAEWKGVSVREAGVDRIKGRIDLRDEGASLELYGIDGAPVASVRRVTTRPVDPTSLGDGGTAAGSLLRLEWISAPPISAAGESGALAVIGDLPVPTLTAERHADLPALLKAVEAGGAPATVLVDVSPAASEDPVPEAAFAAARRALDLARAWVAADSVAGSRLVFLTHGACAPEEGESPALGAAALCGLLRSARAEHPDRFALIDTDDSELSLASLPAALDAVAGEPQIVLRRGEARVPRLARRARSRGRDSDPARPIDPESTVLITGIGDRSALVARHLVTEHGARHLLLASRDDDEAEGAGRLVEQLRELGAGATVAACDVADRAQLEQLLAAVPPQHPLGAVVHAAQANDGDGLLEALDPNRLEYTMRRKANAAWHLHELTEHLDLSQFLLFSSATSIIGGIGLGSRAAADAFLEALAAHRQARGLPGMALAWGWWETAGDWKADLSDASRAQLQGLGLAPMPPERGLELFDAGRELGEALLAPAEIELAPLRAKARNHTLPAVLRGLVDLPARRRQAAGSLAERLAAAAEPERAAMLLALVRMHVGEVLGSAGGEEVDPDRAFLELGLDSLGAVELRNRLVAATGMSLPATLVFDYPSVRALSSFLGEQATGAASAQRGFQKASGAMDEPIAIVGMACRYAGGVRSPEELWELVAGGFDALADSPGGSIAGAGDFDPAFFGISPRDATAIDPQQRILLEVAWEALEDAGLDPRSLHGSQTGVFAGASFNGYGMSGAAARAELGARALGSLTSLASGRISYALGLEGPALTVDTACSSSLVTLHLASQALRGGECGLALAGGVLVVGDPGNSGGFQIPGGLAPDGRCKAFAEGADGTAFAEGAGMLVLERLSDAERNGHPILATIRGSAVNQDGASNGLTAPNGPSQEQVIRQALANARLAPQDIDAVEAHGTGTALGDPIEAGALLATYGHDRETPLRLGSIKSNVGHTAAAAGVAGVIKMTMAMREGVLPRTLHVDRPSSHIDWSTGSIELLTEPQPWQVNGRPRRAGVSSFGVSGTNAHVILEEAAVHGPSADPDGQKEGEGSGGAFLPGPIPLPLSAKTEPALRAAAERIAAHLRERPELDLVDLGYSLATTRPSFERRAVILAEEREELLGVLDAVAAGRDVPGTVVRGIARFEQRPVFLFPGHGTQWDGMALELLDSSPPFATKMRECEEALSPHLEWSFGDVLNGRNPMPEDRPDIVQPLLFAMMVSLAALWRAAGIEPAAVVGQSQGEIAAAHVAGGLSLEDAARIVALRSRILMRLVGRGRLLSVRLPAEDLRPGLERWQGKIEVAALTAPSLTLLAGDEDALDELMRQFGEDGVRAKEIPSAVAPSHSSFVEPLREELLEALAPISPSPGRTPFHSTVTGGLLDTAELDAEYWYRNMRQTVLLEPTLRSLLRQGERCFLEVGPHPALGLPVQETIEGALGDLAGTAVACTLRRGEGGRGRFSLSLAEAHTQGIAVDWSTFYAGVDAKQVKLPTYPFQRKRYWLAEDPDEVKNLESVGLVATAHPILGAAIEDPAGDGLILSGRLATRDNRWLADHEVGGTVIVPSSVFVELALQAGAGLGADFLVELTVETPIGLAEEDAMALRVSVAGSLEDGSRPFSIHSRADVSDVHVDGSAWTCNARGILSAQPSPAESPGDLDWQLEGAEPLDVELMYDRLAEVGLELNSAFRAVRAGWRRDGALLAEIALGAEQAGEADRFGIHPVLLDAVSQVGFELSGAQGGDNGDSLTLAQSWKGVGLRRRGADRLRIRVAEAQGRVSVAAVDERGESLLSVGAIERHPVAAGALGAARLPRMLHRVEWSEVHGEPTGGPLRLAVLGPSGLDLQGAEHYSDLASLLSAVESGGAVPDVVLVDERSPSGDLPEAAHAGARRALDLLKAWASSARLQPSRLTFLTSRGFSPLAAELPDLAAAPVCGMVQTASSEHPGRFALIDIDDPRPSGRVLSHALALGATEPQLAIRKGRLLAPRLARAEVEAGRETQPIDPRRTVLITGGTSGIGALVARHLVTEHGALHMLLASRSGEDADGALELKAELEGLGASVAIAACDVADRGQLEDLLRSIPSGQPLGAVVHSAAVLDNTVLGSLDAERLEKVMRPKVDSAWHLHELTKDLELSQFLVFSSLAGLFGSPAQANYSAANVFLDALASYRHAQGLPATSIAWGRWEQGSEQLDEAEVRSAHARMDRLGIMAMSAEEGLELFDLSRAIPEPLLVPVSLKSSTMCGLAEMGVLPPLLRGLVRTPAQGAPSDNTLQDRLAVATSPEERSAVVVGLVRGHVADVLGCASVDEVEPARNLQEVGFDSLAMVELRTRLTATTGASIPVQALTDNPTVEGLARQILGQMTDRDVDPATPAEDKPTATLVGLLREARQRGTLDEFVDSLSAMAGFRPSFEDGADASVLPELVRLAEGSEAHPLFLFPSAGATSGPHEYVRFASCFRGNREVMAQPLPGFGGGEALAGSVPALARVLAEAVLRSAADRPFALAGHSSGGWVAHAVATRLESEGITPSQVFLLDTYWPQDELMAEALPAVLSAMDDASRSGAAMDDTRLTAMGWYFRLFADWRPESLAAPTIAVRASQSAWDGPDRSQGQAAWALPHTSIDVPGDHFSMMGEYADSTSKAVQEILDSILALGET